MNRILALFFLLASFFVLSPSPAPAQQKSLPQADFILLRFMGIEKVAHIIDPQTVQLQDGRLIRLAGLDFPDYSPHESGELSVTAIKVLQDMLVGQEVNFYQTKRSDLGRVNRMGHEIGHLERKSDGAWAQGTLLSLGLARVRTTQRNNEMALQLYAWENEARKEKIGLWGIEEFRILTPEEAADHERSFRVVQGKVEGTALNQNRVYLNFGGNWREDFTVSIAPEDRRHFSKAGLDPLQWGGMTVRVRGWIESYNGPFIEIDHPAAIELIGVAEVSEPLQEAPQDPMVKSITVED